MTKNKKELIEISPETYPEPIKKGDHYLRRLWVRWAGSIAFVLIVIVGSLGLLQLQSQATATRDGLLLSCEDRNIQKEKEVEKLQKENLIATVFDPRTLVPDINIKNYRLAISISIKDNKELINSLKPTDCEKRYPEVGPLDFLYE